MNECKCVNGVGAVGPVENDGLLCPNHEDFLCVSCDTGYHLDGAFCLINECTCDVNENPLLGSPGVGALGPTSTQCVSGLSSTPDCSSDTTECPNHLDELCVSCFTGYYLSDGDCLLNECICQDGTGAIGPEANTGLLCPVDGQARCRLCNPGHHLDNHACPGNVCTCSNGVEATGTDCSTHESEFCTACDIGFTFGDKAATENTCVQKLCQCNNGIGFSGTQSGFLKFLEILSFF